MTDRSENFGDALKSLRMRSGLSQSDLAGAVYHNEGSDARRQRIGRMERDSWTPPDSEIAIIASVLAQKLGTDAREVRAMLLSQKDHREDAMGHIRALQVAVETLLAYSHPMPNEIAVGPIIEELHATVKVLLRLSGLVPESFFWDVVLRYISFQGVGTQFTAAKQMLSKQLDVLSSEERQAFDAAVVYFNALQNRGVSIATLPKDSVPVDMMRMWVNILREKDELIATHYASVAESWSKKPWREYHRANIRAKKRGVDIKRFFIYNAKQELEEMDIYMREQADAGIIVKSIPAEALNSTVLDIAVVMEKILGVLTLKPNEPRTPVSIDFIHLERQPAQAGLVAGYRELLEARSVPYAKKLIRPAGLSQPSKN